MAKDNIDILLDADGDDKIENGDFAIGDGVLDDCNIIVQLNQGSLKSDPLLGPTIIRMMNSNVSKGEIVQAIKLHLKRDDKEPKKLDITNGSINIEM